MNKKHIAVIVIFVLTAFVFSGCSLIGPEAHTGNAEEGITYITINDNGGRTVRPHIDLDEFSFELFGTKSEGSEVSLLDDFGKTGASLVIEAGEWDFTLKGYRKDNEGTALEGFIGGQTISATEPNTLAFEVAPPFIVDGAGNGHVKVTIILPANAGVESAEAALVETENTEGHKPVFDQDEDITVENDTVTLEKDFPVGDFLVSIELKDSGGKLKGRVTELICVRANLSSEKEIILGAEELSGPMVEVKRIVFDNLNNFKRTSSANTPIPSLLNKEIYEFQRGGDDSGVGYGSEGNTNGISTEKNHTTEGSGKSFKWRNVTATNQKVKFDKIFSPADVGRTFSVSMWIYSDAANEVELGVYSVSNAGSTVNSQTSAVAKSPKIAIQSGWNELTWDGYTHTNSIVTQLAVGNFKNVSSGTGKTFYIDDILIKATPINEDLWKHITFEDGSFVEGTDWQKANWPVADPQPVAAALDTGQNHTVGGSKSVKFSGRNNTSPQPSKGCAVKLNNIFDGADTGKYNISAWVYNPAGGNWVQLGVYAPGSSTPSARCIGRVEPGWNKVEWRGYEHTSGSANTQLGIAQPTDVGRLDTFYLDDIVITKVQ
jgi:hypothetical protein